MTERTTKLKIGLFTDTYHPTVNGIVVVVDILREQLEKFGHEVIVFCPTDRKIAASLPADPKVIRFPSVKGAFYEDYDLSLFFPPKELKCVKEMGLDVILFLTPGQIGLMGVYAATKLHLPLVAQYSTDLYEYVDHYPLVLPGIVALAAAVPFAVKLEGKELVEWLRAVRPGRRNVMGKRIISGVLPLINQKCAAVVVLSRKSLNQLRRWQGSEKSRFDLIPIGVDPLPPFPKAEILRFRSDLGIMPEDKVLLYVGRLGSEKNIELLISAVGELFQNSHGGIKLLLVGDFEYRVTLEKIAEASPASESIIFAGKMPRESLGLAYGAADIFVFPSLTDTQGLVLHEAALFGLPIVMVDDQLSEVVIDGKNGFIVKNDAIEFAAAIKQLLNDPMMLKQFGASSLELGRRFSETIQARKLSKLLQEVVENGRSYKGLEL